MLAIVVPRGWLIAAVVALAPVARGGAARARARSRPAWAARCFVYGALRKLAQAFPALGAAVIAWRQVAAMFAGAGRPRRAAPASPRRGRARRRGAGRAR